MIGVDAGEDRAWGQVGGILMRHQDHGSRSRRGGGQFVEYRAGLMMTGIDAVQASPMILLDPIPNRLARVEIHLGF